MLDCSWTDNVSSNWNSTCLFSLRNAVLAHYGCKGDVLIRENWCYTLLNMLDIVSPPTQARNHIHSQPQFYQAPSGCCSLRLRSCSSW
jgi:hypothetical protein